MNTKVLKTLEYHKIIDRLTELAGSVLGKELCKNLLPSSDIEEIRMLQAETSLALAMLYQKGHVSFSGITDIRGSLKRLEVGSILGPSELLAICHLLEVCSRSHRLQMRSAAACPPRRRSATTQAPRFAASAAQCAR